MNPDRLMEVITKIKALTPVSGPMPDDLFSLSRVIKKCGVAFGLEWTFQVLEVHDLEEAVERMLEAGAPHDELVRALADLALAEDQ